jgi:hypothetical protein
VREAAVQEEMQAGIRDLVETLSADWLKTSGVEVAQKPVEKTLQSRADPEAQGFLAILGGAYEEALAVWESGGEEVRQDPHVLAGRLLANELCREPKTFEEALKPLPNEELDQAVRCIEELGFCRKTGNFSRLADALKRVTHQPTSL